MRKSHRNSEPRPPVASVCPTAQVADIGSLVSNNRAPYLCIPAALTRSILCPGQIIMHIQGEAYFLLNLQNALYSSLCQRIRLIFQLVCLFYNILALAGL
ncbi:protein of unknown function [Georgfuchsia toluolica]|uniref:Uncharacterized protein n=1 Tax=Georgfuchsia toluolica TaxID=424218 RepID=A0A916J5W3_9PROT|nr:protein of unknown function [Georgfuchsia toluolica]